jgi:RimJ/RimL family protein N-acetyltransferase
MAFKTGSVVRRLEVGGKKVVFRYPKWEDLDDLLRHINSLVEEKALVGRQKKVSRKEEIEWLSDVFRKIENGNEVLLVAEVDGKFAGNGAASKCEMDATSHVADLGVSLGRDFRNIGVGTELVKTLIDRAKRTLKSRVAKISFFEHNDMAKRAYEKTGLKETGRIPKGANCYGKYYDEVIMTKQL